jgi:transcriptional regulator with XRE-family HTH domain
MRYHEEFVPNERLRRARSLKGWSQAEVAEQVGTSFEMVSRWERGVTVPSPYYRERLCAVLGQTPEELGLRGDHHDSLATSQSLSVFLASSHADAEHEFVARLKADLKAQGITTWSSRAVRRQGNGNTRKVLQEAIRASQGIMVIASPDARTSPQSMLARVMTLSSSTRSSQLWNGHSLLPARIESHPLRSTKHPSGLPKRETPTKA